MSDAADTQVNGRLRSILEAQAAATAALAELIRMVEHERGPEGLADEIGKMFLADARFASGIGELSKRNHKRAVDMCKRRTESVDSMARACRCSENQLKARRSNGAKGGRGPQKRLIAEAKGRFPKATSLPFQIARAHQGLLRLALLGSEGVIADALKWLLTPNKEIKNICPLNARRETQERLIGLIKARGGALDRAKR